ncbi:response regulator [Phocaeicola vulgatus]|uniref:response regulator n=1 Tax=Phocaeicola vulgatus TaxID=821 RepID=UPI000E5100B6|nr:response regulator [Phocaeicola vulgatus]RGS95105.1 response regulator [Phocaeicola vulgatus]
MNKTKIIVVEDNIVYCEYVCNMLSREGYRNMKAYHLSTAKKHLQQATDNDIVVADLRLPDGSGIDLLCWMRKEGKKVMGAVLQAQEGVVMKEHLELAVTKPTSTVSFALRNDAEDKERILRALKQANGNRSVAAELLGIGRTTLYSKLEEYGLKYKFKQS